MGFMKVRHDPRPSSFFVAAWILASCAILCVAALYAAEPVHYPGDFRSWVHVGTGVIIAGANPQLTSEEGMHHVFANPKAIDGYAKGDFADGSIVVYELREAQQKIGVITEGDRRRVDVMIKDSSRYGATGGWRFERFWANDQAEDAIHDSGAACFACHSRAKDHGFIFSQIK
jgi:cytochrome P460